MAFHARGQLAVGEGLARPRRGRRGDKALRSGFGPGSRMIARASFAPGATAPSDLAPDGSRASGVTSAAACHAATPVSPADHIQRVSGVAMSTHIRRKRFISPSLPPTSIGTLVRPNTNRAAGEQASAGRASFEWPLLACESDEVQASRHPELLVGVGEVGLDGPVRHE